MDLVSVVIPTRNRARLLRQTLRSVLDQSWQKIEPIVVDEASEDETPGLLASFSDSIRVIRHDTAKGPSAARNRGVRESSGKYVLFLDDDDLLHPRHIEELTQVSRDLPQKHIAASGWRRFRVTEEGVDMAPVVRPPECWGGAEAINAIFGHAPGCLVWGPSVLWPRELAEDIRWDEDLFTNGDIDFYARVLESGYIFRGTQKGMAYYRSHHGVSVSGRSASESQSNRSIVSSAKCRLKHSKRLQEHSEREQYAPAMRHALMRVLLTLTKHGGLPQWTCRVKRAYQQWGGGAYYLPNPPENRYKEALLKAALRVGGLRVVGGLLRARNRLERIFRFSSSSDVPTLKYENIRDELVGNGS